MERKNKIIKRTLGSIAFLMFLVLAIVYVTSILSRKASVEKYADMKTTKQYDVLFFGTSHVVDSIYPNELWNDYGILSYNCAGNANMLPVTYYMMHNILSEYQAKVVVVDVFCVDSDAKILDGRTGIDCQHVSFDWMPLSKAKIEAINYLFDDWATRMEFLFPLSIYHDRWTQLEKDDFWPAADVVKGAEYGVNQAIPADYTLLDRSDMDETETLGKEYLRKIIEECQAQGIEVLLTNIPYPATDENQRWANSVQLIADEYGVNFVNMMYEDTGVNFSADCSDADSHLNPSGGRRVTSFLGNYLKEHYDLTDHRDEAIADSWNENYRAYAAYKWNLVQSTRSNTETYLSLIQDQNLNVCLYLQGGSDLMQTERTVNMIQNLGDLKRLEEACSEGADYFLIIDRETNEILEYVGDEAVEVAASFETFSLSEKEEDGMRSLKSAGIGDLNLLLTDAYVPTQLMILSYDKVTGELVDWAKFDMNKTLVIS